MKEKHLRNLFAYYLQIRDFYYAGKYIEEYHRMQYTDSTRYMAMLSEINALCQEVKEANSKGREMYAYI